MASFKFLTSSALCLCLALPVAAMEITDMQAAYDQAEVLRKTASSSADISKALDIQQALYDQGNRKSLLRIAQLQAALGQGDAALKSFETASAAGSDYARFLMAQHHAQGDFGAASQPELGLSMLKEMLDGPNKARSELALAQLYQKGIGGTQAQANTLLAGLALQGNSRAADFLLRNHERRSTRMSGLNLSDVTKAMEDKVDQGDTRAAKVLARAYLRLARYIPNAAQKHKMLVADHLDMLPAAYQSAEIVSAQYNYKNHAASARDLATQLEPVTGEAFAQAALRLRGIEKTAFVYVVQKELSEMGAYSGSISGKLTRPTINAMFAYCRENEIFDTCQHGPLNYDSSRLIARAIGADKAVRLGETAQN